MGDWQKQEVIEIYVPPVRRRERDRYTDLPLCECCRKPMICGGKQEALYCHDCIIHHAKLLTKMRHYMKDVQALRKEVGVLRNEQV